MSVNITVSGKFAKNCRYPLIDREYAKKVEEKERRKLRLLQVREESKKLAKKIRDEINEEKKRELQRLQDIKQKELECWRQHALQRKNEEYAAAIFQVGTAHEAAKKENQLKLAKQNQPQSSHKDFKKQIVARKCQREKVKFSCVPFCSCQLNENSANKDKLCTCTKPHNKSDNITEEAQKRKRDLSFSSSDSEYDDESESDKEQSTLDQSLISLSCSTCDSSTLITCDKNHSSKSSVFVPTKHKCLIKTPSVLLNVEVGSDDSVTINAPAEVKDKHCRHNRQFSSVIRLSPRKERQTKDNTGENSFTHPSSTTTMLSSDITGKDQNKVDNILEKSQNNQLTVMQMPKEKRFTIISELVKKQQENPPAPAVTKSRVRPLNSQATSAAVTRHLSPKKQLREVTARSPVKAPAVQSPRKTSATSKSSRTLTTQPLSSATTAAKSNSAAISSTSCSGRVQFYDYNSKLAKERDQSATAVTIQRQRDQNLPSAMEQAELEKQKERERQLEELKKQQQIEERGQKALEREQIRRDCKELTDKLEVLSQEYAKQLPANDNQLHIFADKQLRKEGKMNSAIEKLIQRPSIITCSEPCTSGLKQTAPTNKENLGNTLNVATLNSKPLSSSGTSSDSCCSILLGYVNDQSKLIKQDIQKSEISQNQSKQKRLKDLLKRLDNLRNSLIQELENESKLSAVRIEKEKANFGLKEDNLKQVIDSISELRKEHEEIIINEKDKNSKSLREREKLLKAKEQLLERKVREFFELQNQSTKTHERQANDHIRKQKTDHEKTTVCTTADKPLEIVITVKGDATKSVKVPQQHRRKICLKRTPNKKAALIKSPPATLSKVIKHTPKKKPNNAKQPCPQQRVLRKQNSYDSNSTSYMSLPPELPTKINDLAEAMAQQAYVSTNAEQKAKEASKQSTRGHIQQQQEQETESSIGSLNSIPPPRVNPLIAQYINRLLGMSREAVQKLGVSSSEVDTPSSSIIHAPGNIALPQNVSEDRLRELQSFIEENKSFIEDLEQSIRSQNNVSLENSLRKLDDIWRKRLKNEQRKLKTNEDKLKPAIATKQKSDFKENKMTSKDNKSQQTSRPLTSKSKPTESQPAFKDNLLKDLSKSLSSHGSSEDKESTKSNKAYKRAVQTIDKSINAKLSTESSKTDSATQMARYAQLTENCTHRIAELTELINRVREEKQRILEVTLSSVSDNGRHSTEYNYLPEGKSSTQTERLSSSSEENTSNKQPVGSNALTTEMPKLTSADKNKQLANSRDSGIADSRPVTALENRYDPDPPSQTSSESAPLAQAVRKMKPPPTLKRFSPQLPDEELAHELSTIFEVDTPATSRINTAIGHSAEEKDSGSNIGPQQQPAQFPTFEEYIEKLNLDVTQLNADQNLQLQQEFQAFVESLQQNRLSAESPKYFEFPSITSYIQQLADCDVLAGETLEESLAKLHISGIKADHFPAVRDYIQQRNASKTLQSDTQQQQFLDTQSLENITDAATRANTDDNDTASVDIQEELKKRKIIKQPFRVSESRKKQIFSSTAHRDAEYYKEILVAESGIDKLSTSYNTSDLLDSDVKGLARRWSREMSKKPKAANVLSSSTTTSSGDVSLIANSALRAALSGNDNSDKVSGRSFNLRDFLIRELEKNASNSGSTSNSSADDSLRSHFLHSLLGSLTPYTPNAASKSGGQTLDRQKTSTPVPLQSSRVHTSLSSTHSSSSGQLFSGESRLSSVHYQNRTEEQAVTSEDANADHSLS